MSSAPTVPPAPAEAPSEEPSGRQRLGWLLRHSKLWLVALVLLLIAVAVAGASLAVFTSSSANPDNTFSAGTLSQSNSSEGAAILTAADMVPGDTKPGQVTITNTGDVSGRFSLSASNLTDTPGPNGGRLSEVLTLQIHDNAQPAGTDVYNGDFNAMPASIDLGSWPQGQAHTYTFTVRFPEGGQPGSATTGDNAYQGSSTEVTYNWTATSE